MGIFEDIATIATVAIVATHIFRMCVGTVPQCLSESEKEIL